MTVVSQREMLGFALFYLSDSLLHYTLDTDSVNATNNLDPWALRRLGVQIDLNQPE